MVGLPRYKHFIPLLSIVVNIVPRQIEMKEWWLKNTKHFPVILTEIHKMVLGDLTGQLPILLDTLLRLALEITEVSPINDDEVFDVIVGKLWSSPEASAIVVGIYNFAQLKNEKIIRTDPSRIVT